MKEFLRDLTLEQCYELVVEAYSNTGGLEMARAVLSNTNNSDPLKMLTTGGVYVVSAGTWATQWRTNAAEKGSV